MPTRRNKVHPPSNEASEVQNSKARKDEPNNECRLLRPNCVPASFIVVATFFCIAIGILFTNFDILSYGGFWLILEDSSGTSCDRNALYLKSQENSRKPLDCFDSNAADSCQTESVSSPNGKSYGDLHCDHRLKGMCGTVDRREKLSLQEFRDIYDGKWPVIVTDVMSSWPAMNWTPDLFQSKYGRSRVTMTTFANSKKSGFSVPLETFLKHLHVSTEAVWTYVQDELFLLQRPELRADIQDTIYTEEDFFKLLPDAVRPWDCMLLWGTAHSRSSLHVDPYNWTGTNAVISGLKRWKLLPPGQDKLLSIRPGLNCGFPLECVKYNSDLDLFDPAQLANVSDVRYLEADQGPGDMLFIPPGWFHQAYNEVPTLAVAGQMMNTNNYKIVLEEILKGGSVQRSFLLADNERITPKELVKRLASLIPQHILEEGASRTEKAIRQLRMTRP